MYQLWVLDETGRWMLYGWYQSSREAADARFELDGYKDYKVCRVEV